MSHLSIVSVPQFPRNSDVREWLCKYGNALEGFIELARAAAVFRSGRGVDVRAEALGALLALIRVYRDSEAANPSVVALEAVRSIGLLAELVAGDHRFVVLSLLECAKAAARLTELRRRGGAMLGEMRLPRAKILTCACGVAAIPETRNVDAVLGVRSGRAILAPKHNVRDDKQALDALFRVAYERRTAAAFAAFATPPSACPKCRPRKTTTPNALPESGSRAPENPSTALVPKQPAEVAAEIARVMRPLAHLLLLRTCGTRSWKAWGGSLVVDIAALALAAPPQTEEEEKETRRRQLQMLLYIARSPLFDILLHAVIRRIERALRSIPIIGAPVSASIELLVLLQKFWFYTAGS